MNSASDVGLEIGCGLPLRFHRILASVVGLAGIGHSRQAGKRGKP